jgi:hypothetical protein
VKEALRLQKENSFVILDVRPEAEFKQVSCSFLFRLLDLRLAVSFSGSWT